MYVAPLPEVSVTRGGKYGGIRRHKGVDLVAAPGTPVRAIVGGTVHSYGFSDVHGYWGMWAGVDGNYWNAQHLLTPFGPRGRIEAGQVVALSGATGGVTGPHLHQGVSTIASLTVGTFNPEPIILSAPQSDPEKELPMLTFHRVTTATPAQQIFVTGASQVPYLIGLTTDSAAVALETLLRRWLTSAFPPFSPAESAQIITVLNATAGGSGGSGLTLAEHNQLFDIANKGELGQALTSTAVVVIDDLTPKITAVGSKVDGLGISHS